MTHYLMWKGQEQRTHCRRPASNRIHNGTPNATSSQRKVTGADLPPPLSSHSGTVTGRTDSGGQLMAGILNSVRAKQLITLNQAPDQHFSAVRTRSASPRASPSTGHRSATLRRGPPREDLPGTRIKHAKDDRRHKVEVIGTQALPTMYLRTTLGLDTRAQW
ncbi:hypothetical protein MRV_0007 [Murine roseolovirus]|uniref:Uncharacterized protein n=1 Tax=Murid betaherpesvirus 3 TaxID=2560603 RepID=A0A1P8VIP7_9BETA|nr:hypothetical protein MRV_0007 [Murine roseolovirus]APZ76218.1 hypothetical protein MRV_0007 [Murid betaherpesvirus 3]